MLQKSVRSSESQITQLFSAMHTSPIRDEFLAIYPVAWSADATAYLDLRRASVDSAYPSPGRRLNRTLTRIVLDTLAHSLCSRHLSDFEGSCFATAMASASTGTTLLPWTTASRRLFCSLSSSVFCACGVTRVVTSNGSRVSSAGMRSTSLGSPGSASSIPGLGRDDCSGALLPTIAAAIAIIAAMVNTSHAFELDWLIAFPLLDPGFRNSTPASSR